MHLSGELVHGTSLTSANSKDLEDRSSTPRCDRLILGGSLWSQLGDVWSVGVLPGPIQLVWSWLPPQDWVTGLLIIQQREGRPLCFPESHLLGLLQG